MKRYTDKPFMMGSQRNPEESREARDSFVSDASDQRKLFVDDQIQIERHGTDGYMID